jgi:hypothetical protein
MKKQFGKILFSALITTILLVIGSITASAASTPFVLTSPDSGWTRYQDQDSRIFYGVSNVYGGFHYNAGAIKFSFTGTKLRLIYQSNVGDKVSIDGGSSVAITPSKGDGTVWCAYENTSLSNGLHSVVITTYNSGSQWNSQFDAVDIDSTASLYSYNTVALTNLSAVAGDNSATLTWDKLDGATSYTIKRGTVSGSYDTTFTSTTNNYIDKTAQNGIQYYYVVTATTSTAQNAVSTEVSVTPQASSVKLDVTSASTTVNLGDEFTADIVLRNATGILAEDVTYTYDSKLFEYEGYADINGLKVQTVAADTKTGTVRFIVSSLGKNNAITGDKSLIQLKFKAIAGGTGKIDATKGRVADIATESDISPDYCGEITIVVQSADVNKSGDYTLVDLAIDSYYYGDAAADTDTTKYNCDQNSDSKIDDKDLSYIVTEILKNPAYTPNKA